MKLKRNALLFLISTLCAVSALAPEEQKPAADDAAAIAKKLANPIGALISVPFQNNMDIGIGDYNGSRNTLNIQPIVPFSLTAKYSLITRYILPVIAQYDITGEGTRQSGLGDALVSGWTTDAVYRGVSVSSVFPSVIFCRKMAGTRLITARRSWKD